MLLKIYDGAESIGGTKIYLKNGPHGLFLDFGINFEKGNLYFKEYLRRRAIRGIYDPITLGLLPKIKIYRKDLIPADLSIQDFEEVQVEAVVVTHAHADHFGEIGNLRFDIPIVASPVTLLLIKAMEDCGHPYGGMDAIYSSQRIKKEDERILLTSNKREGRFLRKFIPTERIHDNILEFMGTIPGRNNETMASMDELENLPWEIKGYPVDHSIYGSTGYIIEEDITIAYTGDFRLHGEQGYLTEEFAKRAKDASLLIIEGTRLSREEHDYTSEEDVRKKLREELDCAEGLVIVDFSPRNFERLKLISEVAGDRIVLITEKDAYMLNALKKAGIDLWKKNIGVYRALKGKKEGWLKYLREDSGMEDRYVDPREVRDNLENYILSFSLYDFPNLLDIKPSRGIYIYSSTEALTEEQEFDFMTIHNWLSRFNFKIRGFSLERGKLKFSRGYHASGHASPEDIIKIVETIDPEIIVPVHTTNPKWFSKNFENVKILKNGESLTY